MELINIIKEFDIKGEILEIKPLGNGHINDTNLVITDCEKYTFQRINTNIFKNPHQLMTNLFAVTEYLKKNFPDELTISYVRTKSGDMFYECEDGAYRLSVYIDNVIAPDTDKDEKIFYECAVAFGHFQKKLANFPADTLFETIPDFHNTMWRLDNLKAAIAADKAGRLESVKKEVEFALAREKDIDTGVTLPLRVTHNDTKQNNVLLDEVTYKGVCVIDLDTIMPGLSINDFGDSIRFGANTADEDERDLDKMHFSLPLFESYTKGFFEGVGDSLTKEEIELLPHGAWAMTYECGIRFLTDYLEGDTYFKTAYPEHNLVRAHTQFKLVYEMEQNMQKMLEIVKKYAYK